MSWTAVSLAVRWLLGWWIGARTPTLAAARVPRGRRAMRPPVVVSVIVPARNEARTLPALLASLARQQQPAFEVVVVDDQSSDATAAIAARAGAIVVQPGPPPAGWLGKPWACAHGAQRASGEVLVFVDADTTLAPAALDVLVPIVLAGGGLVSVAPYHETRRPYEWASALFNLVALIGTGALSAGRAPLSGAFGPCLAMPRDDYDRVGGHHAVADQIVDDVALAQHCRAAGLPVRCYTGGAIVRYRMYPEGLRQLVDGWSKNVWAGARGIHRLRLLSTTVWMSGLIEAGWGTIISGLAALAGAATVSPVHAAFYVAFAIQLWIMLRRIGNFGGAAVIHPALSAAFLTICVNSVWLSSRSRVRWKGRDITVKVR